MLYFKRHILCAAPLAFVRLQPINQAVAPIVLNYSCYYIGIAAFRFGIPAKTIIVEQRFTRFAVFLWMYQRTRCSENIALEVPIIYL